MPEAVIGGILYRPCCEIPPLTDDRLKRVLEILVEIQASDENHKAKARAWNALFVLAPELAELSAIDAEAAVRRINPIEPHELREAMLKFSEMKQVVRASQKAATMLQAALLASPDAEWLTLDYEYAKEAYQGLILARSNTGIFASELPDIKSRLVTILEYSLATICLDPCGKAQSHAGRSRSSVGQLNRVQSIIHEAR